MTVREPLGSDWVIQSSTHPGHRSSNQAWDFQLKVHPHQVVTLTYTAMTSPEGLHPQDSLAEADDPEDQPPVFLWPR
jgi:hypothetical protein